MPQEPLPLISLAERTSLALDPVVVIAGAGLTALGAWRLLQGGVLSPARTTRNPPPAPVPFWGLEELARLRASAAQASGTDRARAALSLGPRLTQAARSVVVAPGLSTRNVADRVSAALAAHDLVPSLRGHNGFPDHVAVSQEPGVVHGLPTGDRVLLDGTLVTLEAAVCDGTGHAALTWTLPVGDLNPPRAHLCSAADAALEAAVNLVGPLARTGDVGAAIARSLRGSGLAPVVGYAGYTVGPQRIASPRLSPLFGRGTGPRLSPGQVLFVLALARQPTARVVVDSDGWSAVTRDKTPTAAASALMLVTEDGAERLTGRIRRPSAL